MACHLICKKHIYSVKFTDVFFIIVYLLKIIINIIKANTIIVSTIKLNKSNFIISNKIYSIIAPPPCSQHKLWIWWQTSSAILLFMIDSISYILLKINTFYKNKFSLLNYIHNFIIWKIFFHLRFKKLFTRFSHIIFIPIFSPSSSRHFLFII